MVCIPSSAVKRYAPGGFTLVEAVMAMGCGVLVLAAVCLLWGGACESLAGVFNYVDMANSSKNALDRLSQEIRNARSVALNSSTAITVTDLQGTNVVFSYDAGKRALTRARSGQTNILLQGCNALSFSVYKPVPSSGTYDLALDSGAVTGKVLQVKWSCYRLLTGSRTNTEGQVSAKVVVRN